ncbi:MAG TPA: hypothetical protein VFB20_14675 [Burkholderiales bacterium]|nr:hypothetical protein [Burkholderiales bacterium]
MHRIAALLRVLAAVALTAAPASPRAQDTPAALTFEQAQQRTAYARSLMEQAEQKLRRLERADKSAQRELADAQKRYEQAKADADKAAESLRAGRTEYEAARRRWEQESENLLRIHREDQARHPSQ